MSHCTVVFFCNQSHKIHSIPQVFAGSFAVDFGDHLRLRIICGPFWGSFAVSGSFAVGDHLRYSTVLRRIVVDSDWRLDSTGCQVET